MPNRVAAQVHPAGDLLRLQAAHGMNDNLGTADKGCPKRVRPRDPLNFRPLIICQVPQPKHHGPAPRQIGMILQQPKTTTILAYLPDAPLSWYFTCVVINLFETSHIGSMNTNRTCSRPCHYDAGMTVCRPSSDMEKVGLRCGAED
jgi:hypothetical protein